MYTSDSEVSSFVVLGSKPQAPLPLVAADVVIGANGAVEVGVEYRNRFGSYLIGIVPLRELRIHKHICESVMRAKPDELIIVTNNESEAVTFTRETLLLPETKVTVLSHRTVNWKLLSLFGNGRISVVKDFIVKRGIKNLFATVIPDILFTRNFAWTHRSTGMSAIMYALKRFPNASVKVFAGIGLVPGSHFNNEGEFTSKTSFADMVTAPYWPIDIKKSLFTTDAFVAENHSFPLWADEVFYWK